MPDGQVTFQINGDNRGVKSSIADTTRSIEQETKKWDSAAGNAASFMERQFTSMLGKIGAAFSAAKIGQMLLQFGQASIAAASDLREVQNVVDTTFGESASQIEAWAKTAQSQFGLTETQAKQFTSTLGAMMKSAGLAGPEIVNMSTDLAGLAADMASFYNMDFETAFQKIRSGISGETEPLKQLGINMSVANLEAYALTQGITKSFDQMTQGEQTMLRYQYLMQATADAQGDFAKTADGYANAQRRIETAISNIQTSVGTMLLDVIEPLTTGLATFLEKLTSVPDKTVIDQFKEIDSDTERKMANITQTADDARALIDVLQDIQTQNVENPSLTNFVTSLTDDLGTLDTAMEAAKNGNYAGTIRGIAEAMETKTGVAADQWETLLTAVSERLPAAAQAVDENGNVTEAFLSAAADAAAELGGEYPGLWQTFMDMLGSEGTKDALAYMANGQAAADAMESIGISARGLTGSEESKWSGLLGVLETASPTKGMFGSDATTAAQNIAALAQSLSSNDPSERQQAWSDMLGVLTNNIDGVAALAKQSPEDTRLWLEGLAQSAAELDPNDPAAWDSMFNTLVEGLPGLKENEIGTAFLNNLETLATDSNRLDASSGSNWSSLLSALNNADTTKGIFGADAAERIASLASALSDNDPAKRKGAWSEMLSILTENADSVARLTGQSPEEVIQWFRELDAAVPETGENLEQWNAVLTSLVNGLTGLGGDGLAEGVLGTLETLDSNNAGSSFFTWLMTGFMGLDSGADQAAQALRALGIDTAGVEDTQALWLKTCQQLVKTIPGLSSIIDVNTGEIRGGIDAVIAYVDEWENANKKLVAMQALRAKEEALANKRVEMTDYYLAKKYAENRLKLFEEEHENLAKIYREQGVQQLRYISGNLFSADREVAREYLQLIDDVASATRTYDEQAAAVEEAEDQLEFYKATVEEMPGDVDAVTESTEAASDATHELTAEEKELSTALKTATSALEEVEKYYNNTHDTIKKTLSGLANTFDAVKTPAQKAAEEVKSLEEQLANAKKRARDGIQLKINGAQESIKTIGTMSAGLRSQIAYYDEYNRMMERARELGYSDEILASLADGTAESFDYLTALTDASIQADDERITQLNAQYAEAAQKREELSKGLTDQQLKTDEAFQNLVDSATAAIEALNLSEEAKTALEQTVNGIASGISLAIPAVEKEVKALNAVLNKIGSTGRFGFGTNGLFFKSGTGNTRTIDENVTPLAVGMDYVPFDNYLAALHEGESVLTAEEARVWRAFKTSGMSSRNTIDYDALGATMRDNVHAGGNVYLDGQTVGRVISARQADSYRAMERSGFQR